MKDESFWEVAVLFTLVVILPFVLFAGGIAFVVQRVNVRGELAQIEQLRTDASNVNAAESEDVIGQVTQWNQRIRSQQRYNDAWYASWLIPNAWDRVQPIQLPRR